MHTLPKIFFRWGTQIVHMLLCPFFCFVFILLYEPFRLSQYLDMGRDGFAFNLSICFAIAVVLQCCLRVSFHYMKGIRHFTWAHYIIWCMGEVMVVACFVALFLSLEDQEQHYLNMLMNTTGMCYLMYIFPYTILTLSYTIAAHKDREKENAAKEAGDTSLIRFLDIYQRPKLIISPYAVLFIEARENYVNINYTESGKVKKYELRATMASLEDTASKYGFIRCQRSFYVNPAHVTVLRKETGGIVYAELDEAELPSIPVSKKYYDVLAKVL